MERRIRLVPPAHEPVPGPGGVCGHLPGLGGRPAGERRLGFFPQGSCFAGLFGGSTLEAYRGRGLYTALLAARAQEALRRGYQFLHIDAGDMSRPIVERHGFHLLAETTPYMYRIRAAS